MGNLAVDTNGDGVGDGAELTTALTSFGPALITGTGNTLTLRISVSAAEALEEIAFDQFGLEAAAAPEVTLSLSPTTATEAAGTTITATATADKPVVGNQTVDVDVITAGSVTSGDFDVVSGTITILDGQTTGTTDFVVQNDAVVEATETATIEISNPSAGILLGTTTSDTVDITDNDTATVTIDSVTVNEDAGTLDFTVSLDSVLEVNLAVDIDFSGGTATGGGTDYASTQQQVLFVAGTNADKTVMVSINNDAFSEANETFNAAITTTSALGGRSVDLSDGGVGTINNDDGPATLTVIIAAAAIEEDDGAGATTATVSRNTDTAASLTVMLTSNDLTEASVQTMVTIAAGQTTSAPFNINAEADAVIDGDQTVTITASAAGHNDGTDTVIVEDDDVAAAPKIEDVTFYNQDAALEDGLSTDSTGQRSIIRHVEVVVDGNITVPTGAVANAGFVLQNLAASANVGLSVDSSTFSAGKTTIVLSFTSSLDANGSLIDGNYQLTIDGGVLGIDGNGDGSVGGSRIINFHRLFGDSDGDRDVDGGDYMNFYAAHFGDTALTNVFDVDDDDMVADDIMAFFAQFGKILNPFTAP